MKPFILMVLETLIITYEQAILYINVAQQLRR
jgi:hypothetical protein